MTTTMLAGCRRCGSQVSGFGGRGDMRLARGGHSVGTSVGCWSWAAVSTHQAQKTKNAGRRWRETRPADMERGRSMEGEMRCRAGAGVTTTTLLSADPLQVSQKTPDRKLARASAGPPSIG